MTYTKNMGRNNIGNMEIKKDGYEFTTNIEKLIVMDIIHINVGECLYLIEPNINIKILKH